MAQQQDDSNWGGHGAQAGSSTAWAWPEDAQSPSSTSSTSTIGRGAAIGIAIAALLTGCVGGGVIGAVAGGGNEDAAVAEVVTEFVVETEPAVTETVTETASAPATTAPSQAEAVAEPDEPAEPGTYTAGQWEFRDVQLREDFVGDYALRTRVTNTGPAVEGAQWRATLLRDGTVVGVADGVTSSFASGDTRTIDFLSQDPFQGRDVEVEFQLNNQF